jgi:AcrR family transcriptional regulator
MIRTVTLEKAMGQVRKRSITRVHTKVLPEGGGTTTTFEKIIGAAIHLFNQHGIQNVAMSKIAGHVGISPGNLAYHFKSKRDMLLVILPRIEQDMQDALRVPVAPISLEVVSKWQIGIFRYLWKYRFFFHSLTYLFLDDAELRGRYSMFEERIIVALRRILDGAVEQNLMRPVAPPNATLLVATNMWMLWLGWLRSEQVRACGSEMVEDVAIYDGALCHFSLMQPYYGKKFARELLEKIGLALGRHLP